MFKDAKVGDKVWSVLYGWGKIIGITYTNTYPITVGFDNGNHSIHTFDGKQYIAHIHPTLFWDAIEFISPKKPQPKLEVDTKILVWDLNGEKKYKRYFSHFTSNGRVSVFDSGMTSWSTTMTTPWENYELYDEETK